MGMVIMNGVEYASAPKDGFPPIIYSDEEREIGVWRDGRPLYQKCINLGTLEYDAGDYHYVNHNISNIDKIVECMGICSASDNQFIQIPSMRNSTTYGITLSATATAIRYSNNWITSSGWTFVILQYTKTTDVPGSGKYTTYGGLAHHYNITEQVIGTWIDGKPLYEKTIYCGDFTGSGNKEIAHNISNLGRVVKMFGAFNEGTTRFPLPIVMWGSAVTYQTRLAVNDTNIIISRDTAAQSVNIYVTLQYTKTTD